jgi:hypothetical protein
MPERIPTGVAKNVVFRAIASADHFTPKTAISPAITIRKWGGSFGNPAAGATTATEIASGFYYFALGTGDTDTAGPLAWRAAVSGMDDAGDVYEVVGAFNAGFTGVPAVIAGGNGGLPLGDASGHVLLAAGTGTGQLDFTSGVVKANATQLLGTAWLTPAVAGTPDVNAKQFGGAPVTATTSVTIPAASTLATTAGTIADVTNQRAKYMHGAVWIGAVANTNTTIYVDGIMTNPVSTIAAAKSIADSLGLKRFWSQAGVTVSLGADYGGYVFDGIGWTLATSGSRAFTGSVAKGAINVTGTYTSTGAVPYWDECEFGATASIPPSNLSRCTFLGTTTLNAAGNYDFIDCASIVAGTSAPVFAVPAGTVNISFRRWSGGIHLTGLTAGTTVSIDVVSGGTVTLEGTGATVVVRGMVTGVTNSMSPSAGSVTTTATCNQTVLATPTNITAASGVALSATGLDAVAKTATGALALADAVWDEALAGHSTAGSAGLALSTASTGGVDPAALASAIWKDTTAADFTEPASVGKSIMNGVALGTGLTVAAVTTVNGLAANAITAASLAADAGAEIADALLDRDMATGTDSGSPTVRTPRQALRTLRNKWSINGATITYTKEDDTAASHTATLTGSASADPVVGSDPA